MFAETDLLILIGYDYGEDLKPFYGVVTSILS